MDSALYAMALRVFIRGNALEPFRGKPIGGRDPLEANPLEGMSAYKRSPDY